MQQHGSKYFTRKTPNNPIPMTLMLGSKGQIQLFSEHVILHIKLKRITNEAPL